MEYVPSSLAKVTDGVNKVVRPYLACIYGESISGLYGIGSGAVIRKNGRLFLVTAAHVAGKIEEGYHLALFNGQGEPPDFVHRTWIAPSDKPLAPKNWREDVVALDITNDYSNRVPAIDEQFLADAGHIDDTQGIFLCGFSGNPCKGREPVELLQRSIQASKVLITAPFCSPAPYRADAKHLKKWQFALHFPETGHRALDGRLLPYTFTAKGLSGSLIWRVKGSPPSFVPISLDQLEAIGIATRWRRSTGTLIATRISVVQKMLESVQ